MIGGKDITAPPLHSVPMNADIQQKELMAVLFTREDFASADTFFKEIAEIQKKFQNPARRLIALCASHGLAMTGIPRKKLLALFSLLILAKHTRLP